MAEFETTVFRKGYKNAATLAIGSIEIQKLRSADNEAAAIAEGVKHFQTHDDYNGFELNLSTVRATPILGYIGSPVAWKISGDA